jgi:hypothetical protein
LAGPLLLAPAPLLEAVPLLDPTAGLLAAADDATLDCALVGDVLGELELLDGFLVPLVQPAINERQLPLTAIPRAKRRIGRFADTVMRSFCPDT